MYLERAIDAFTVARKGEGYAAATLRCNKYHLEALMAETGNIPVSQITASDIDRVFSTLANRVSSPSLNQFQATYQVFFRWCRTRKLCPLDHDPAGGRRMRKVMRKEKPRIPASDFGRFLNCAPNPRDRAMCAIGLYLMLRQSEATDLRIGDLDLAGGYIQVRVFKTKDEDLMPISLELEAELRTYMAWYTAAAPRPLMKTDFLLPARSELTDRLANGRYGYGDDLLPDPSARVTQGARIIRRVFAAYGWDMDLRIGMHDLRRSGARALFDELASAGYDGALRTVQSYLHHASGTMTERYLGLAVDRANRDKKFRGKPMFPSMTASANVVELRRANG